MSASHALRELERIARNFGPGLATQKRELVATLGQSSLRQATELLRLHEVLCFARAYPDDAELRASVVRALEDFAARKDTTKHRRALTDTGVVGTSLSFPFHWITACWLVEHWPAELHVDWPEVGTRERERLEALLPLLVPEAEALDPELGLSLTQWLAALPGEGETDATFLVRRFARLSMSARARESLYNELALPLRLELVRGAPTRTLAVLSDAPVTFQTQPLAQKRPALSTGLRRRLRSVRRLEPRDGRRAIELARTSLITRGRDLDGIMYASPDDVRLIDTGDGFVMTCMGLLPRHRALVETLYVFLLIKNGVPVGYFQAALLFGSAEVNYHVFPTFRGAETAEHYVRALGVVGRLFGAQSFSIHPYQLGHENPDALAAGAFWFYQKLGFQPDDAGASKLLRSELRKIAKNPKHRSSRSVLRRLASGYLFHHLAEPRNDVAGKLPLARFSLVVSRHLGQRFGSDRERGLRVCAEEFGELTGVVLGQLTPDERVAWERWAPLALALPGVTSWSKAELRALGAVVRAKGATNEQDFARRLDRHRRLRAALVAVAGRAPEV
ncbi:MAG: hypothetical protein IPI67_32925 [Myxococcales bacterium]|nr:hypothetical protein [Myxococcales bacterium]